MKQQLIIKLQLETGASDPTIRKWLGDPSAVLRVHDYALSHAAKRLKLEDDVAAVRDAAAAKATGTEG